MKLKKTRLEIELLIDREVENWEEWWFVEILREYIKDKIPVIDKEALKAEMKAKF